MSHRDRKERPNVSDMIFNLSDMEALYHRMNNKLGQDSILMRQTLRLLDDYCEAASAGRKLKCSAKKELAC